jgi:NAD(P)-dependent dehydrogenase (short-subunit alcohol dehydrogenase family)
VQRRDFIGGLGLSIAGPGLAGFAAQAAPDTGPARGKKAANAEGCVALVTGANQGIGNGFVRVLLERGAKRVYATARRPETFPDMVALDPDRVVPLELDVTNDAHRRAAAAAGKDVTWLINNAGNPGSATSQERRFLSASSLDDAKRVMDTNCWSPAELARLFAPVIVANGGGAIVNILSVGALFSLPEYATYCASKAAAANMTEGLRAELDRDPVLVAGVYTGGVDTMSAAPGGRGMSPTEHAHEVLEALAQGETSISAGSGSAAIRQRVCEDPEGFEHERIERFYNDPITIRRHL